MDVFQKFEWDLKNEKYPECMKGLCYFKVVMEFLTESKTEVSAQMF